MSVTDRIRLDAMCRVKRGELSVVEAAGLMEISLRQARRIWKRYQAEGDAGLLHRLRGRPGNHRLKDDVRDRAVKLHQEKYADFGPTFACEKLAAEGVLMSPDSLTALLKERGLWVRRRRRGKHRKRRERRSCFGMMVQMDGSHHDWFEGRDGKCVLMVVIDDATNRTFARFYPGETTDAVFDVFGRWVQAQGLPRAVYVDRHSIYRDEDHPEKPTQFGRAMVDLGVKLIRAHSPQAKGRVERRNAVFQDRLVKEMRLRGISGIVQANLFLDGFFLADINRRYAVKPEKEQDMHVALASGLVLEEILCVQEKRVVGLDWCVRWKNRFLQIHKDHAALNLAKRTVRVKERGDGQLVMEFQGQRLNFTELSARPKAAKAKRPAVNNRRYKPSANHPWRNPGGQAAPKEAGQ